MNIENGVLISVDNLLDINHGHFTIPDGVTSIDYAAFYECTSLTSVTIPDSVTSIGGWAFRWCTSLTSITIPDSVTSIGEWAFGYCKNLTSATIPDSVTSIGACAFYGGSSLTSVIIPEGVTSIGNYVFYGCTNLTSVTIHDGVTSIGVYAFRGCENLTSVRGIYKAMKPDMTCRGYQFVVGEWSEEVLHPALCLRGYHFCTNLFDIFDYYYGEYGKDLIICECEVGDTVERSAGDRKCATNRIKPLRVLTWAEVLDKMSGG